MPFYRKKDTNGKMYNLNNLLKNMVDDNASDLHLSVGTSPRIRKNGQLLPIDGEKLSGKRDCKLSETQAPPD